MKHSLFVFIVILLTPVLYLSCEYEPEGVYKPDINKDGNMPEVQIDELNLQGDPVYLYEDKVVQFSFSCPEREIRFIRVLLDGEEKKLIESSDGKFKLDHSALSKGRHQLKIEIYVESGTGSIADQLGAEMLVTHNSWTVFVE